MDLLARCHIVFVSADDDFRGHREPDSLHPALRAEADDAGIAAYLTDLYEAGRSPATASMTVAALRFRGRHTGAVDPVGPLSERVLAGFRRQGADRGRGQVTGIRHEEARQVARQAGRGGLAGLRDAGPDSGGQ